MILAASIASLWVHIAVVVVVVVVFLGPTGNHPSSAFTALPRRVVVPLRSSGRPFSTGSSSSSNNKNDNNNSLFSKQQKPGDFEFDFYDDGIGDIEARRESDSGGGGGDDDDDDDLAEEFYEAMRRLQLSDDETDDPVDSVGDAEDPTTQTPPPPPPAPSPPEGSDNNNNSADRPASALVPRVSPMVTLRPNGSFRGSLFEGNPYSNDDDEADARPDATPKFTGRSTASSSYNTDNSPGFGRSPYYANNLSRRNGGGGGDDLRNPRTEMMQREFNLVSAASSREAFLLQAGIAFVFLVFAVYIGLSGGILTGDQVRDFGGEDLLPFQDFVPVSRDTDNSIFI